MEGYSEELIAEIQHLIEQRWHYKQQHKWEQADDIQRKLLDAPYHVKVIDNNCTSKGDGCTSEWTPRTFGKTKKLPKVVWETLSHFGHHEITADNNDNKETNTAKGCSRLPTPFVIGTVDSSSYRDRYKDTILHLEKWRANCSCCQTNCCTRLEIQKCHLLNLQEFPSIGIKKILFEGWRQKLVPKLRSQYMYSSLVDENNDTDNNSHPLFVFVAEDDIRFPNHVTSCQLAALCEFVFLSHPELDMLSLGHSWKALCNKKQFAAGQQQQSLLDILQSAKGGTAGVHASTLMAIRVPEGLERLQNNMDRVASEKKQTHLDQFLFFSPYHTLQIALSDPPLAGWAEVETTLTLSASGHRRRGGGRLGFLPSKTTNTSSSSPTLSSVGNVVWVQRCLEEERPKDFEK